MIIKRTAVFLFATIIMLNGMVIVQAADTDGDSYDDDDGEDACPGQYGESTEDRFGCPDFDGDGWSNLNDVFPNDPSQWADLDGDGFGDNPVGTSPDACPATFGSSYIDMGGCPDTDLDGISDINDQCPVTSSALTVDQNGCATSEIDTDNDGVTDDADQCADSSPGAVVNMDGCSADEIDTDSDGIADTLDQCTDSNPSYSVDENGCAINQLDSDSDGVIDLSDICQDTQLGDIVDNSGCSSSQIDTDGDGHFDAVDEFPMDATQHIDTDLDGFGDNLAGNWPDDCVTVFGVSTTGLLGCPDTDGDGLADLIDQCPTEASNFSLGCPDIDGDGFLDYGTNRIDSCVNEKGTSDQGGVYGCWDSDKDGWSDIIDAFNNDTNAWGDGDSDGFTDQSGLNYSDDCPSSPGNSTVYLQGCPDIDGDGIPDFFDEDIDGDGIINAWEKQVEPSTDVSDSSQTPKDTDGDGLPDDLDRDDDDDGFPDDIEKSRGSNPLDSSETPLNTVRGVSLGFATGLIYSATSESAFSADYNDDGFEISITRLFSLLTSGAVAFILPLVASLPLLMKKKSRFKTIRNKLEEETSLEGLELLEYEIDDLITKKRLRIDSALLLRNLLERKQDQLHQKTQSGIHYSLPIDSPSLSQPPPSSFTQKSKQYTIENITVDSEGYEWTKSDDGLELYRKSGTADWQEWH